MTEFMFEELVALCRNTHEQAKMLAARSADTSMVVRNWLLGRHIVEFEQHGADRAGYGDTLIPRLSEALTKNIGKGFSSRNLELFRKFYTLYREISQTLSAESDKLLLLPVNTAGSQNLSTISRTLSAEYFPRILLSKFTLSWSQYVELFGISDPNERHFYEIETAANNWGVKELRHQIAGSLYQRLALSRDRDEIRKLATHGLIVEKAADIVKNPYVLEFLELDERSSYTESELESAIIDKLENFLLELGKGFLFEARQKRFTFDNDHFYVDLVFYNRLLRSYVLIDLKRDKLTHQDLGQMQMYVNYFDRHVKTEDELPTIGIVLCHRKNDALVELTLPENSNIYASEYQLYLPSKEELRQKLLDWTAEMDDAG